MFSGMAEDEEDSPKRKKKRRRVSRKKIALLLLVLFIFAAGAAFQHFVLEPIYGDSVEQRYATCLSQKKVLDERFSECQSQLQQLTGT